MLILSRKKGEDIHIGDDIIVSLLSISGSQARIGINAPKNVPIHREEVYKRVIEERKNDLKKHSEFKSKLELASTHNGEINE